MVLDDSKFININYIFIKYEQRTVIPIQIVKIFIFKVTYQLLGLKHKTRTTCVKNVSYGFHRQFT